MISKLPMLPDMLHYYDQKKKKKKFYRLFSSAFCLHIVFQRYSYDKNELTILWSS